MGGCSEIEESEINSGPGRERIKYQLFDMDHQKVLVSGIVEKIGEILWDMLPDGKQLGGV